MPDWLAFLVTIAAAAAAAFGYLAYQRGGAKGAVRDEVNLARREEAERLRRASEERLRDGLHAIEARLAALEARAPHDAASTRSDTSYELLRREIASEGHRLTEALFKSMTELRAAQAAEAAVLAQRLTEARALIQSSADALEGTVRQALGEIEARQAAPRVAEDLAGLKDALSGGLERIEQRLTESLSQLGVQQVGRLEQVARSLDGLRGAIDAALKASRNDGAGTGENSKRLTELEAENARLRVALAELTLEKLSLGQGAKHGD